MRFKFVVNLRLITSKCEDTYNIKLVKSNKMESEIQIFFNNVRLLGPKIIDFETTSKQVRVPVNAQMFQKSNHKGMAIILQPLLCFFDEPFFRPMFDTCWFPYGLAEMK